MKSGDSLLAMQVLNRMNRKISNIFLFIFFWGGQLHLKAWENKMSPADRSVAARWSSVRFSSTHTDLHYCKKLRVEKKSAYSCSLLRHTVLSSTRRLIPAEQDLSQPPIQLPSSADGASPGALTWMNGWMDGRMEPASEAPQSSFSPSRAPLLGPRHRWRLLVLVVVVGSRVFGVFWASLLLVSHCCCGLIAAHEPEHKQRRALIGPRLS